MVLEEQYVRAESAPGGLGQVVGDFLRGKRINPDDILRAAGEIFAGGFGAGAAAGGARVHPGAQQHRPAWDPRNWDPDWTARQQQHQQQRQRSAFDPEAAQLQRELAAARMELGFEHRAPLTVDVVEKRRKELARKHHPDLGGNPERMVRINQAADLLVAKGNLG